MASKKMIKEMFEKEFNAELMKQKVLDLERDKGMNLKVFKWSIVPICLVAIICGTLFFRSKNLKPIVYEPNIEAKENVKVYFNDVSKISEGVFKLDADVKVIKEGDKDFAEISDVVLPNDFMDEYDAHAIYTRQDKNSDEYNVLQNYVVNYSDRQGSREIKIAFSKDNKPIRDYHFAEEGSKVSTIKNKELKIFKYEDLYFTEFNHNGINFDIETININEQELINLLLSIIK